MRWAAGSEDAGRSTGRVATVPGVRRLTAVAAAGLVVGAVVVTAAGGSPSDVQSTPSTSPLRTALLDPAVFTGSSRATGFALTRAAGASYVRLGVPWQAIAPSTPPSGFVATDPTSPGYNWDGIDSIVNAADAAGLTPILDIKGVPGWAYEKLPHGVNAGTPRAADLGDFATALATQFDGSTPGVPAEHVFQVWNEPNLSLDLDPVNASSYRAMVNAVSAAVHTVDPANLVVAGALDPFGHPKSKKQLWYSMAPLAYMRALLCVSKGAHPHSTCKAKIHFDVWSHHPYTFGGPFGKAKRPDDVELGDLPRMRAVLNAGIRLHHVVSAKPVQFWVTEFGWDTNPPRAHAPSLSLAARWTAESLHQMWRSGVSLVTWYLLQDFPNSSPYQSGLYFYSSSLDQMQAKPSLTAFRFPFVAYLGKKRTVSVWGRDATSDQQVVAIQLRHGTSGTWQSVAQITSNANGIFLAKLKLQASKADWLRAVVQGSYSSLGFSLTKPKAPRVGPWGN